MRILLVLVCVLLAGSQIDAASFYMKGNNCFLKNLFGVRLDVNKLVARMDANQDGVVSIAEDAANINSMDTNKDGYTSRNEFVTFVANFLCYPARMANVAFDFFDRTKDGRFTSADILTTSFDANGNAKVSALKAALSAVDKAVQAAYRKREITMEIIKHKYDTIGGFLLG